MPDGWATRSPGNQEKKLSLGGLQSRPSLWPAEREEDTAFLRTEGHEIEVEDRLIMLSLDNPALINDVLVRLSPLDMRLMENKPNEAILHPSEAA